MAVASWMLRNRNTRSNRFTRSKTEHPDDVIKLDLKLDPQENAKELLNDICKLDGITEARRINCLNAFIKVILHIEGNLNCIAYTVEEILCCLRVPLINESTLVRCASLKAIRHILTTEEDVQCFNELGFPYLVARSLDLALKNDMERLQALSLIRKVVLVSSSAVDISLVRTLVSLSNGGIEEKDRLLRGCLACLSEIGVLNADVFILAGGVAAITRNLMECQTPRIAESLCGVLLFMLDRPITRNHAAVDLHCIAAPYCDFHYRHGWMDKNRDERELRFNCSRLALLSVLRSWPGILHFCSPANSLGLKAIVDVLYLNKLEVRKAVLDLLYELLGLPQPEWTDELSVALSAIDPAEPQASWRINEGFIAAEGRSVLPHLARTTPNITDVHIALLLYCFLETGLLGALAEVIATSDTFISVRATVLLGELLRLIHILLPPQCCDITPALPNLLGYATQKPMALAAITALQQLHKLLKRRPASSSLYLDYILQSGSFMKRSRNIEQRKYKLSHSKSKLQQLVLKNGEDIIRDTGVLLIKDAFAWNWNIIKIILKGESDFTIDLSDSTHLAFIKRLVEFYLPSKNRYSHMDLAYLKNIQGYTTIGIDLINCFVSLKNSESNKLLLELFTDISNNIAAISSGKSAHDCLFSPQHMLNTQCQSYFLFVGRFARTKLGNDMLTNLKIYKQLQELATTTKHDCYVKLIISSLDYGEPGPPRDVLGAVLTCSLENSRLYATQFLQVLLRAGIPQFFNWGIKLLTTQLQDNSKTVQFTALTILHEACEVPNCLEQLVKTNPDLLEVGEKGIFLLIRFLSIPSGFNMLKKNDFVVNELRRWDEFMNFRYVRLVESEAADTLTLHQRGDDGKYDKRLSSLKATSRKDVFLPPHIYGELAKHSEGFTILQEYGSFDKFIQCVEMGLCENEHDILKLKAALWVLAHLSTSSKGIELLLSKGILTCFTRLAQHCVVYSVRATALLGLSLIATTRFGADCLFKLGWVCTRHDRHNHWPIIEEEKWQEETNEEHFYGGIVLGSDSEHTSSDHAFTGDVFFNIPDADSTTTEEDFPYGFDHGLHQKSSTLPNQSSSSVQHKRSLSESKTFDVLKVSDRRAHERVEFRLGGDFPQRYRDNSITESTTSGVSSCESVLGRTTQSERVNTLSPIPSSSSLSTFKTSGMRIRRHSESGRRISLQSMTTSERSTVSPAGSFTGKLTHQDALGYTILRSLRIGKVNHPLYSEDEFSDIFAPESLMKKHHFHPETQLNLNDTRSKTLRQTYLDTMSLTSISSVQKFSIKDDNYKRKGQCYLGICLPKVLVDLFPDNHVMSRRLSFSEKAMSFEDNSSSSTSTKETKNRKNRFSKHDMWLCLSCSRMRRISPTVEVNGLHLSPNKVHNKHSDLKCEILKQVERLGNPVWIKPARQALLHHKQQNPSAFQDLCLYSEVCKMLSENMYRLGPRRLLQELFLDVSYKSFYKESNSILNVKKEKASSELRVDSEKIDKLNYSDIVAEQRKAELSNKSNIIISSQTNRRVISGFNINKSDSDSPRSPPLSSVKEENYMSTENLNEKSSNSRRNSSIPTLDSLNLSYSQNKFPIRNRSYSESKNVIK